MSPTFQWQVADSADLPQIHSIHTLACQDLANDLVRHDSLADFQQHLADSNPILTCRAHQEAMIGYGVLALASASTRKLADLLQLSQEQKQRFAVLDGAATLAQWRKHGVHQAGIRHRITLAAEFQRSLFGVTVAPANVNSLRGLFHAGFVIESDARMYGDQQRLILQFDRQAHPSIWEPVLRLASTDLQGQQAARAAGLRGFALQMGHNGEWEIRYGFRRPATKSVHRQANAAWCPGVPVRALGRAGAIHQS